VLVIPPKSRLEGRSALRLACCGEVRLVCCDETRLAACCDAVKLTCGDAAKMVRVPVDKAKLEWLPLDAAKLTQVGATKLARGLPVNKGTPFHCDAAKLEFGLAAAKLPWPVNKDTPKLV
jgi:hypothetical protein